MNRRISKRDEFLLSQLLDGDLPAEEAAALRRRIEREPQLRAAHDSLARVDELLKRRRADQPTVDWPRFHREVMDAVGRTKAAPARTIPLSRWLWIGAPLAAAAAIVLIVSVYPYYVAGPKPDVLLPSGPMVSDTTPHGDAGEAVVRVQRPALDRPDVSGRPRVSFARLPELDKAREKPDEASRKARVSMVVLGRPSAPKVELPVAMFPLG